MKEVEIEFNFDDEAKSSFESGDIDPPVGARIRVGETYVVGGTASYTREYIEVFVIGLLEAGLAVLRGEQYVLDYYIDEMYLVFEPIDETKLNLAFCYTEEAVRDPSVRDTGRLPEVEATTPLEPLVDAIETAAEDYVEMLREHNLSDESEHVEPLLSEMDEERGNKEQ